jgi:hypothetical protein
LSASAGEDLLKGRLSVHTLAEQMSLASIEERKYKQGGGGVGRTGCTDGVGGGGGGGGRGRVGRGSGS